MTYHAHTPSIATEFVTVAVSMTMGTQGAKLHIPHQTYADNAVICPVREVTMATQVWTKSHTEIELNLSFTGEFVWSTLVLSYQPRAHKNGRLEEECVTT